MIETREQYQQIIDTMPTQAIGKAMYLTATIEALREVARAANNLRAKMWEQLVVDEGLQNALADVQEKAPWLLEDN